MRGERSHASCPQQQANQTNLPANRYAIGMQPHRRTGAPRARRSRRAPNRNFGPCLVHPSKFALPGPQVFRQKRRTGKSRRNVPCTSKHLATTKYDNGPRCRSMVAPLLWIRPAGLGLECLYALGGGRALRLSPGAAVPHTHKQLAAFGVEKPTPCNRQTTTRQHPGSFRAQGNLQRRAAPALPTHHALARP